MKILHLTNDYSGSTVYKNLVSCLDEFQIKQIVYNPIRDDSRIGKNNVEFKCNESQIYYRLILNYYSDRFFFKRKICKIVKDVINNVDLEGVSCVHAHTWYSDGAVAYELYKKYKIPYIVTIRNTDLNVFYKYMYHLREYGKEILYNAQRIVFISKVYNTRFNDLILRDRNLMLYKNKSIIIPNGIDSFWHDNMSVRKDYIKGTCFNILFIGKFDVGKNVLRLIEAIKGLRNEGLQCSLTLIGGKGNNESKVLTEVSKNDFVSYVGTIHDKSKLKEYLAQSDLFAMPSKAETFGLVYLEALSQGIPILNTINEGIYGMYDKVGESVKYNSVDSIKEGIVKIMNRNSDYNFSPSNILKNHRWTTICKKYIEIYNDISDE